MVLSIDKIDKVGASVPQAPPKSFINLIQSGAISEAELIKFFGWLDGLIRSGNKEKGEPGVEPFLHFFFAPDRVAEIAGRIRATAGLNSIPSGYSPDKPLTDYLKLDKPIVFFDIETAGVEGEAKYKVVELSVVKYYPNGKKEAWTKRFDPEMPIQKKATEIHGINDIAVGDCPTFKQDAPTIYEFFKDCHLGGFNILKFDVMALQKEFSRINMDFSIKEKAVVDPMFIYHKNVPYVEGESRTLTDAVTLYCGKDLEDAHQAKADILATIEVLKGQFEMYSDLPGDIYKLSDYCQQKHYDISDFVDPDGKFVWDNGEIIFNFSKKHKGEALREVVKTDKGFLFWMINGKKDGDDFSREIKDLVQNALKGIYPSPPRVN